MKALENNADILNFSQKLNNLDDDNLFLIASSYDAEVFDKKVYTINSIINKIKALSKEELIEFDKQINEILKKKDEKELAKKNNVEPEILISDRIFFLFAPKVNVNNAKLYYFFPINVAITIYFMIYLVVFFVAFSDFAGKELPSMVIFHFFGNLFLFISMTNEISSFAKVSLFWFEFYFLILLFIKRSIKDVFNIIFHISLIYMSYIQLIVTKNKEYKKLKE